DVADRLYRRREQQRLADGGDLGRKALLSRLRPERPEVGRDHDTSDDLAIVFLECGDLSTEVRREVLVAARIEQAEPLLLEGLGEAQVDIAPGVAVAIVGEQATDFLVGGDGSPHRREHRDDVLQAPEEVIGPLEPFTGLAATAEEPG